MPAKQLRLLAIGAHPDDCDLKVGGLALLYVKRGHAVKFVSTTDGSAGHHEIGGAALASRRLAEAQKAAKLAKIEYQVLANPDGGLEPSLENRREIVRIIREFAPDVVITHRPNDYHPDHRYTSQLVQDAAYMVTVPNAVPLVPHLRFNPVFAYMSDRFRKPCPFEPDAVVRIDSVFRKKVRMLACHESQVYGWLVYNYDLKAPPRDPKKRLRWLAGWWGAPSAEAAAENRELLAGFYGRARAARVKYAEAFEICEYGRQVDANEIRELFCLPGQGR